MDPTADASDNSEQVRLPNLHSIVDGIYRKMRVYIKSEIDKHSILSNKTPGKTTLSVAVV